MWYNESKMWYRTLVCNTLFYCLERCGGNIKKLEISFKDTFFAISIYLISTLIAVISNYLEVSDNNVIALYIFAIVIICLKTKGYTYGIIASISFIMQALYLKIECEPFTIIIMLLISIILSNYVKKLREKAFVAYENEKIAKEMAQNQHHIILATERELIRSNLLRAISHDLRTPLTTISGSASAILGMNTMDKAVINRMATSIKEDCNWLIHMVENLLAITKISDTNQILTKTEELVEEVVSEACSRIKSSYPEAKLKILVPDEIILLPMEFTLIEQVLFNLIENSIKYSKDNGNVMITVSKLDNQVSFEVRDHGIGLSDKLLKSMFHSTMDFNDDTDNKRGMGIGLTICHSIIKAHKGEITAENAKDGGAVFTFYLPIEE